MVDYSHLELLLMNLIVNCDLSSDAKWRHSVLNFVTVKLVLDAYCYVRSSRLCFGTFVFVRTRIMIFSYWTCCTTNLLQKIWFLVAELDVQQIYFKFDCVTWGIIVINDSIATPVKISLNSEVRVLRKMSSSSQHDAATTQSTWHLRLFS